MIYFAVQLVVNSNYGRRYYCIVRCPDLCLSPVRFCLTTTSRCGRCNQGRLNQWAHWAFAQDPRIFFLFEGPPTGCGEISFLNNYLIVDATA